MAAPLSVNVPDHGHVSVRIATDSAGFVDISKTFGGKAAKHPRDTKNAVLDVVTRAGPTPRGKAKSLVVVAAGTKSFHPALLADVVTQIGTSGSNAALMEWLPEAVNEANGRIANILAPPRGCDFTAKSSPTTKAWSELHVHKGYVNLDDMGEGLGLTLSTFLAAMNYDLVDGDILDDGRRQHIRAALARRMWESFAEDSLSLRSRSQEAPEDVADKVRPMAIGCDLNYS